jgi:ATP-binding cassette subfamily C (CFTR/MRP) protein 4
MLCVIGKVGVGKTSLLNTIMGETVIQKGTSKINGTLAYVEQEPFIFAGTVKENILFGKELN